MLSMELRQLEERANRVAVIGNREYNAGWHTALDLQPAYGFRDHYPCRR